MVKRELYLKRIRPFYDSEMVKVLTGIRRCGKSTLMRQIIEEIRKKDVKEDHIVYINFEDYRYRKLADPDCFYEYVESRIKGPGKYYLFFDEIQNVKEFELVVNSFRSTHDASIFITGSNSKLLSGELATHLGGRTLSFRIMPFCYREFLEFKRQEGDHRGEEELLSEFIDWGGIPLVCKAEDESSKEVVLSNIYDSAVLRDIIMRNKIAFPVVLEKILEYLVANSPVTVSANKIAGEFAKENQKVSIPTIYDYIRYITEACICDKVSRYDIRGKRVLAFEEKTYGCDMGIFHIKKNRIKDEFNYIVETICYNELTARGYKVYVGKAFKSEVDFIAEKEREKFYVQAACLLTDESVVQREFGAYDSIADNYPKYVVTMDPLTTDRDGIIHKNLIDFLLEK